MFNLTQAKAYNTKQKLHSVDTGLDKSGRICKARVLVHFTCFPHVVQELTYTAGCVISSWQWTSNPSQVAWCQPHEQTRLVQLLSGLVAWLMCIWHMVLQPPPRYWTLMTPLPNWHVNVWTRYGGQQVRSRSTFSPFFSIIETVNVWNVDCSDQMHFSLSNTLHYAYVPLNIGIVPSTIVV